MSVYEKLNDFELNTFEDNFVESNYKGKNNSFKYIVIKYKYSVCTNRYALLVLIMLLQEVI